MTGACGTAVFGTISGFGIATGAGVEDLPNIERIIASAISAGDAALAWEPAGVFELGDAVDGGIWPGVLNIRLIRLANTGFAGAALATGNVNAASRLA